MPGSFWLKASDPSTGQHGPTPATCPPKQHSENVTNMFSCANTMSRATVRNPQDSFQTDNWISAVYQHNNAMANSKTNTAFQGKSCAKYFCGQPLFLPQSSAK